MEAIADHITLSNRSEIATTAFLSGDAGTVRLNANQINLDDVSRITSQIDAGATGSGGSVEINTGQLQVLGGSQISAGVFGTGLGGNVDITASDSIRVIGEGVDGGDVVQSGISTQVNVGAVGQGGQLTVKAATLFLSNGGNLTAGTAGNGAGGSLIVEVDDTITVQGEGSLLPSAIAARTRTDQNAGNLSIKATTLNISDSGTITVEGFNPNGPSGNAGNLTVNARYIRLNNNASITGSTTSGQGGNLTLSADHIVMLFDSEIATTAGTANQPGDGGNITIAAATVTGLFNSDIASNSFQGRGGRIVITAQGIFGLEFRLVRTAENDITAISLVNPELNGEVVLNTPDIDPTQALIEIPVVESPEVVERVCTVRPGTDQQTTGQFAVSGLAVPTGPQGVSSSLSESGVGAIAPFVGTNKPIRAALITATPPPPQTTNPLIAQGWGKNAQGQLVFTAEPTADPVQGMLVSAVRCG
ncbi:hypothetical protein [Spirulina major]|uniref:hypothetical protein n=1 Tax=Spirulina major TaxID=270636 RepID=UPI001FEA1A26|nr:hypothetical protein [Spirulina major]